MYTTQDEEEKAEIEELIQQLREDTDNDHPDTPLMAADEDWLIGTNVEQIAVSGVAPGKQSSVLILSRENSSDK